MSFKRARDWRRLVLTTLCFNFGFGIYMAVATNFFVQELNIRPEQLGLMESIREVAGFLQAFLASITMRIAEPLVGSMAMLLVAGGLAGYRWVQSYWQLVFCSFVWSVGFHSWIPLSSSMALALSEEGKRGRRLGQLSSYGSLATLAAIGFVFVTAKLITMRTFFFLAALFSIAAAVAVCRISRDIGHPQKPRFVFKRRYSLYYLMTMLEGCRRQIFLTFASFLLVRHFGFEVRDMALLGLINTTISLLGAPQVGKLVDKVGERRVLSFAYLCVFGVFIGYALVPKGGWAAVLYCLDSSLLLFGHLALTTYLRKVATDEDVMPTLAMGLTWNHIAAVIVPVTGGLLWRAFGYPKLFIGGAMVVLVSLMATQWMRTAGFRFQITDYSSDTQPSRYLKSEIRNPKSGGGSDA